MNETLVEDNGTNGPRNKETVWKAATTGLNLKNVTRDQ